MALSNTSRSRFKCLLNCEIEDVEEVIEIKKSYMKTSKDKNEINMTKKVIIENIDYLDFLNNVKTKFEKLYCKGE